MSATSIFLNAVSILTHHPCPTCDVSLSPTTPDPSDPSAPPKPTIPPLSKLLEHRPLLVAFFSGVCKMLAAYVLLSTCILILLYSLRNNVYARFHVICFLCCLVMVTDCGHQWEFGLPRLLGMLVVSAVGAAVMFKAEFAPSSKNKAASISATKMNVCTRFIPLLLVALLLSPPAHVLKAHDTALEYSFEYNVKNNLPCDNGVVPPGLYSKAATSPKAKRIVDIWTATNTTLYPPDPDSHVDDPSKAASFLAFTGDTRTIAPFVLAQVAPPTTGWNRRWVPTTDGEHVAVDCSFPVSGYSGSSDVYLLLHGLNGGSDEEYVKHFSHHAHKPPHTAAVCVLIARGLMATPVVSGRLFHGARIDDAHAVSLALKQGMSGDQKLIGVGYSMGAIVLANYVARIGDACAMDYAIGIGGGIDMRWNYLNHRSRWLWQPFLSRTLLDSLIIRFVPNYLKAAIERGEVTELQRELTLSAGDVTTIDENIIAPYNGFTGVVDYYTHMSAIRHMKDVSIPLAMVGAADDPLICEKALTGGDPNAAVDVNKDGNVFLLLTEKGGHVGFPTGNVVDTQWDWMSTIITSFVESVKEADKEM
jgi:predicted alpha/beta-fold hydrolase